MNGNYVQNLRYKLQRRFKRVNSTEYRRFHNSLKLFWGFLEENSVFISILQDLGHRYPTAEEKVERIINNEPLFGSTEFEHAAISYFLIKKCIESDNNRIELNISNNYNRNGTTDQILESFKDIFFEPFYEYLDEHLDDQRAILELLRRYKHKCEWFQRDSLYKMSEVPRKGEKNLSLHLYEYLHDQGLDFTIEPHSVSGIADLIANQNSDDSLIADAKIFNNEKSKGKSYILKGFNQVYVYTRDFNEPFGYLIIYKTCKKDLKFTLTNQTQSVPFIIHNNKTIFFITIDIYPYENPASQRGVLESVNITEDDLIKITEEQNEEHIEEIIASED